MVAELLNRRMAWVVEEEEHSMRATGEVEEHLMKVAAEVEERWMLVTAVEAAECWPQREEEGRVVSSTVGEAEEHCWLVLWEAMEGELEEQSESRLLEEEVVVVPVRGWGSEEEDAGQRRTEGRRTCG